MAGLVMWYPTQKKNILVANNLSEAMVTVRGGDCNSYWLIVRPASSLFQNFMAYKIDAGGVTLLPFCHQREHYQAPRPSPIMDSESSPVRARGLVFLNSIILQEPHQHRSIFILRPTWIYRAIWSSPLTILNYT